MRTPPLHYDQISKYLPEMVLLARQSLAGVSTEKLLDAGGSYQWNALSAELGPSGSQALFATVMFERCGQKVYVIGPKVADAMRRTNLSGVTPDMVVPPVPCFYIALPDCPWRVWGGDRTKWHTVTGVYVQKSKRVKITGDVCNGFHFFVWGAPNEQSENPLDDAVFWHSVPVDGGEDMEETYGSSEVKTMNNPFTGFNDPFMFDPSSDSTHDQKIIDEHLQSLSNVFYLALNMMLYLTSEEADLSVVDNNVERKKIGDSIKRAKSDGKKKKLQRRLDNHPRTVITYVGPKIEQSARKVAAASQVDGRAAPKVHLVRPHWRHYWVGPRGDQRRVRKWINMFERGSVEPAREIVKFREPV